MLPCLLLVPASIGILLLTTIDYSSFRSPIFADDLDRWQLSMERRFAQHQVSDDQKTSYSLNIGLKQTPDVQTAMVDRRIQYIELSGNSFWPWNEFLSDLSNVYDVAHSYNVKDILPNAISPSEANQNVLAQRDLSFPDIRIPSYDEIMRRILPRLNATRNALEKMMRDEKATIEDVMKVVHDFVAVQVQLLPLEIQDSIREFNKFKAEHPWIVAGMTVALTLAVTEVLLPSAMLAILRMLGFAEIGPVAGSWAAAFQSAFYGGRTRGLFSILQSIAMTGTRVWPIAVLTDITAIAAVEMALFTPEEMKAMVTGFSVNDKVCPIFFDLSNTSREAAGEDCLNTMGEYLKEAKVPHVQWFDAMIQAFVHHLQNSLHGGNMD